MRATVFNLAMILDRLAAALAPCLYGLGCLLLAAKLLSLSKALPVTSLAAVAGGVAVVWTAVGLARRGKWFSNDYARAWLDLHNHAGGRVLSGRGAGEALPVRPGIVLGPAARRLALPVLFVVAALVMPEPARSEAVSGVGAERTLARMEREIKEAADLGALAEPDVQALNRQLERLRELSRTNPEAAAEAVSMLPERVEAAQSRRLDQMAEALDKAAGVLAELDEKEKDAPAASGNGPEDRGELFSALDRMVRNEGGMENLPGDLRSALEEALREGGVSGLREMSGGVPGAEGVSRETLERIMESLSRSAGEMGEAGRMSLERGRSASGEGMRSLSDSLERLRMRTAGAGEGLEPGGGDVGRGPGDAPLVFGDESRPAGLRFEHRPLPAGPAGPPGMTLHRERVKPDETLPPEEFREPGRVGADVPGRVHAGGGGSGLSPGRARAAGRYFDRLGDTR